MRKKFTSGKYCSFMPLPKNEKLLAIARRLGINISELVNETLEAKLDDVLKMKIKKVESELEDLARWRD